MRMVVFMSLYTAPDVYDCVVCVCVFLFLGISKKVLEQVKESYSTVFPSNQKGKPAHIHVL